MRSTRRVAARPRRWALADVGALTLALAALGGAAEATAAQQSPLVIEAHGGLTVPVSLFATGSRVGEGTSSGASFGVTIGLAGGGRWTPYVGFSQHRFACEDAGCASDGRYVATGFRGGLRWVSLPGRAVLPWLSAGAITTHIEAGDLGGAYAGVSDLGVGAEVGVGVHIGGASQIAVNPGVRLAAINTELPDGTLLRMRYLVADVALVLSF